VITAERNKTLTEVGPGTPAGKMLRRYWFPIALSAEVLDKPRAVQVLNQKLVLYRGEEGAPFLVSERCPHRGTSLVEGRVSGDNIRCCYHGWLFDGKGNCLEQPGEPKDSSYASRVKITAYPVIERYGMLWAWLGEGEPPQLTPYDILARTDGVTRVARAQAKCNYLQVLENSLDPVHTSVLHIDTDLQSTYEEIPQFEVERTPSGIRTVSWRPTSQYRRKVEVAFPTITRVTLPFMKPVVQMGFWITPVDDYNCILFFSWFLPLTPDLSEEQKDQLLKRMEHHMFELIPDDKLTLSSRVIQQDLYACESQGKIVDRAHEMLGASDRGVILLRKMYTEAINAVDEGSEPPGILRGELPDILHFSEVA
jgi:phenylpropionate dioxygenase-like ring-hydroxylating dioxygenase large terminal subunit